VGRTGRNSCLEHVPPDDIAAHENYRTHLTGINGGGKRRKEISNGEERKREEGKCP